VERDVAAPVDRVLSKEQTTNADERDDKATERYTYIRHIVKYACGKQEFALKPLLLSCSSL